MRPDTLRSRLRGTVIRHACPGTLASPAVCLTLPVKLPAMWSDPITPIRFPAGLPARLLSTVRATVAIAAIAPSTDRHQPVVAITVEQAVTLDLSHTRNPTAPAPGDQLAG